MTTLQRTTFELSRAMEFFSEKELQMQIGHGRAWWPVAVLKELIDNALDACEEAGVCAVGDGGDGARRLHGHRQRAGPASRDRRGVAGLHEAGEQQGLLCVADPWADGQCAQGRLGGAVRLRRRTGVRGGLVAGASTTR